MRAVSRFIGRRYGLAGAIVGILLSGMIGALLWMNYSAQVELHASSKRRLVGDAERLAAVLAYFYAERREDVKDLSQSRELTAYFENRALGMSMAYGLRASLNAVTERFLGMLEGKRFHGRPIYNRIVFLNNRGEVLVDAVSGPDSRAFPDSRRPPDLKKGDEPVLNAHVGSDGTLRITVCAPYIFKNQHQGWILARISPVPVFYELLKPEAEKPRRTYGLLLSDGAFFPGAAQQSGDTGIPAQASDRGLFRHGDAGIGPEREFFSAHIPIKNTPFALGMVVPFTALGGGSAPWQLPTAMGILAVLVLGGIGALWRFTALNVGLQARIQESAARQEEIREKNLQLQTEITERKRVAEALAQREEQYRTLIENLPDVVYSIDASGNVQHGSNVFDLFGYEESEVIGKRFLNFVHPGDREKLIDTVKETVRVQREYTSGLEFRVYDKGGGIRWVEVNSHARFDGEGRLLLDEGVMRDVTARKETEAELEAYRRNLETMVEERTSQLKQAQQELLNKATEAGRAQMAAVVLHNIGNAVTPAKVHLDALKRLQDERIYQYLKKCYQELQRHKDDLTAYVTHDSRGREVFAYMASLIDAFKDQMNRQSEIWERIDTALSYVSEILTLEQTYDPNAGNRTETVDLNRMMEDALHMQAESIRRRDITVFKNLAPGTVNLKLDKSRLMQTIVNLIRNSCEALDASGGAAKKQMRIATFQDNRTAGFVVEDTGVGLAQAEAASFFDFGVSGRGGSGFGLTYSREFVESNGGRIHLTSPGPGKGASVRVEFPKPRAEAA